MTKIAESFGLSDDNEIGLLYKVLASQSVIGQNGVLASLSLWGLFFKEGTFFVALLCFFCLVFAMPLCVSVYCALWSPAGKGLTSWRCLWCLTVSLSLSHWYPGSGVILDCIDS